MKTFKLLSALIIAVALTSCGHTQVDARIDDSMVVEQINLVNTDTLGISHYKVNLETSEGNVNYYTDYKHEIGDTLVSIFEFTDNRDRIIRSEKSANDSLMEVNNELSKKNAQLELYNELLMGIIQDGIKTEEN